MGTIRIFVDFIYLINLFLIKASRFLKESVFS